MIWEFWKGDHPVARHSPHGLREDIQRGPSVLVLVTPAICTPGGPFKPQVAQEIVGVYFRKHPQPGDAPDTVVYVGIDYHLLPHVALAPIPGVYPAVQEARDYLECHRGGLTVFLPNPGETLNPLLRALYPEGARVMRDGRAYVIRNGVLEQG